MMKIKRSGAFSTGEEYAAVGVICEALRAGASADGL